MADDDPSRMQRRLNGTSEPGPNDVGIEKYRDYLGARYRTFRLAFDEFLRVGGRTIVELGTARSFVPGGTAGCMVNDPRYWQPDRPETWDWGAGLFTRICAEHLQAARPEIHTVDISADALAISRVIAADYHDFITFHHASSKDFLRRFAKRIDLLYMDAGESGPDAERLHLREAQIAIAYDRFSPRALVLVDDVDIPGSAESKGRLSIPYLCRNGFEVRASDYQVLLQRR